MIKINLPKEGFVKDIRILYYIKFGLDKIYIGMNGTSNKTGQSSAFGRLATHIKKCGKTKSVIWDTYACNGVINDDIQFGFTPIPTDMRPDILEGAAVSHLRNIKTVEVLNKTNKKPTHLTSLEKEFLATFLKKMMDVQEIVAL